MTAPEENDVWRGVIISESLESPGLLSHVRVVGTESMTLEGEGERGVLTFLKIEVLPADIRNVAQQASETLRPRWYCHFVRGDHMYVVYHGRVFEFDEDQRDALEEARQYGRSEGILQEQMGFERFFGNPYDE